MSESSSQPFRVRVSAASLPTWVPEPGFRADISDPAELRMRLLSNVGQSENTRRRPERSLPALQEALAIAHALGRDEFAVRHGMATALLASDRTSEAAELIARTIRLLEERVGAQHPSMGHALVTQARLRHAQRRDEEAVILHQRARSILIASLGPDHPDIGATWNGEGLALVALGRDVQAEHAYRKALRLSERLLGAEHLNVAGALANLGAAQTRLGETEAAIGNLRRAVEIRTSRLGASASLTGSARDLLGDALLAAGDLDGVATEYRRAIAVFEALGGRDDPRTAYATAGLGRVAMQRADHEGALVWRGRALTLQAADAPAHERGALRADLARLLAKSEPEQAHALREQARAAFREAGPRSAERLARLDD